MNHFSALKEEVDGKFGNALVKGERGCMLVRLTLYNRIYH